VRGAILTALLTACHAAPDPGTGQVRTDVHETEPLLRPKDASPAIQEIVEDAQATLMGPGGADLPVSRNCYFGSGPPAGWFAVRYLLAASRADLVRLAFKTAPSREGRLWGAHGLLLTGELDPHDLEAFAGSLDGTVWICRGCLLMEGTPMESVEALYPSGYR
jgi:hypothetical protein